MCAVTRRVLPEADLIRFVAAPNGAVVADLKAKLPGRGIWVGLDRATVAEAARRNVFARGLKQTVQPAGDLAGQVTERLKEAALGRLGLARRAGLVVMGFAKVEAALEKEDVLALVVAADAANDGRRKIEQALRRRFADQASERLFARFDSAELSLSMGRPNVIHAAVLQGPAGRSFVEAAIRLRRYEGAGDGRRSASAPVPQDVMDE
jgi:predicted RNA-binding protein YlxR (DUF448 family)